MDPSSSNSSSKTNNKKNKRKKEKKNTIPGGGGVFNEDTISNMMREVNQMLQKNPDMVKKVSKCVNNIFDNQNLMSKLVSEINTEIVESSSSSSSGSDDEDGQILLNKLSLESNLAESKESIQ